MKAPRLIHEMIGSPHVTGGHAKLLADHPAPCCMCGRLEEITAPADRTLGANFTDRTMFLQASSDRVCEACLFICSGGGRATFRLWTVIATPGHDLPPSQEKAAAWIGDHHGICLTSRADTTPVIDTLLDPPETWVVSVAESGQKHVLPYAEVNHGHTGTVRMENADIPYKRDDFRTCFTAALKLRRLGIPAGDVETGTPRYLKSREDLETWRQSRDTLAPYLNSPILHLAVWLITKGIQANDKY